MNDRSNFIWGLALGAGSVFVLLLWFLLGDFGIAWPTNLKNHESLSAIVRNWGLLPLAAIGMGLAIWRSILASKQTQTSIDQVRIAQQGQFADRYAKAAGMLSDEKQSVREAGIFALKELAIVDPSGHYFPVQNLLCSFIREESAKIYCEAGKTVAPSHIVEAVRVFSDLRAVERCWVQERGTKWTPDLLGAYLAFFPGHSESIDLSGCDLSEAVFIGAALPYAKFDGCILCRANFIGATLIQADFNLARLDQAYFGHASLFSANFEGAFLHEAQFSYASLDNANFEEVLGYECVFWGSDLGCTDFTKANLSEADFREARLNNAIFDCSNLAGTKFPLPVLDRSCWPDYEVPSPTIVENGVEFYTFVLDETD